MRDDPSKTSSNELASVPTFRKKRWQGPVVALLLLGSLLWITNWFYQRARLFEGANVRLGEPYLPWDLLIKEEYARDFFGQPVSLGFFPKKQLTPYQFRMVGGYTALRDLSLRGVTDADLHQLSGLTNLDGLDLYDSPISDDGLAMICQMTNLQSLTLHGANISSVGLRELSQLSNLNQLGLRGCTLTGDIFAELAKYPILEYLYFDDSTVTDENVSFVVSLRSLKVISFGNTSVTRDACLLLKQARPNVIIVDADNERVEIISPKP